VAANNLWHHFDRFAQVVEGLDPAVERFEPSMVEHARLRIYRLKGRRTTLLWLRDSQAGAVEGVTVRAEGRRVRVFDPWENRWTEGKVRGGRVLLPKFSTSLAIVMK
jgi:hypothetical protein